MQINSSILNIVMAGLYKKRVFATILTKNPILVHLRNMLFNIFMEITREGNRILNLQSTENSYFTISLYLDKF